MMQILILNKITMFFENYILNIFWLNEQLILLIINLLFNDKTENMKLMKICSKYLNFHKFVMFVINFWNSYWTEKHQIICMIKNEWYHFDDNKIKFKLMLMIISAEHQNTSLLINVHIIDNINVMSILWIAW